MAGFTVLNLPGPFIGQDSKLYCSWLVSKIKLAYIRDNNYETQMLPLPW